MIGKLRGTYAGTLEEGSIVFDVGGVGYCVRVAPTTQSRLAAHEFSPTELFIHTAVREDAIDLYGFASQEELAFFKQLVSVSGVGPKTALGILTIADVPSLIRAIARGDASMLHKAYGIGKKSAERIVVELRDKLVNMPHEGAPEPGVPHDADVLSALEGLGYSASESREALRSISSDISGVRERIAAALKHLGTAAHPYE